MRKFSPSTNGFYLDSVHGAGIPADAIAVADNAFEELMEAQGRGLQIRPGTHGSPVAVERQVVRASPLNCTPAQGLVALFALKQITEDNILAAIANIPDEIQRYTARIGYQRATSWERNSPTMQTMAQLLQLSERDLDELFDYAAGVAV